MLLNVDLSPTANPQSLPRAGGLTTVTFTASTDEGAGQLQADYDLEPPSSYVLAGSTHLGPAAVSPAPQSFSQTLTVQPAPGAAADPFVQINLRVSLVGGGQVTQRVCNVTIASGGLSFAVAAAAAPEKALGDLLRTFRISRGLTQEAAAKQAGLTRAELARLEKGAAAGPDVQRKIEALLRS